MPKDLSRKRKRKYKQTNKYDQAKKKNTNKQEPPPSVSAKKIRLNIDVDEDISDFNLLINFKILQEVFQCLRCPVCDANGRLTKKSKYGLRYNFILGCQKCDWEKEFSSCDSLKIDSKNPGVNVAALNVQSVMAFREIGCGFTAMKTFCNVMNMESPMSLRTFQTTNTKLQDAYESAAKKSMQEAALETRQLILKNNFKDDTVVLIVVFALFYAFLLPSKKEKKLPWRIWF